MNWDAADNLVPELAQLNQLISDHPCFFDGAKLTRLSAPDAPVYALLRESAEGKDAVLVLVNTDVEKENELALEVSAFRFPPSAWKFEILGQPLPRLSAAANTVGLKLPPGAAFCLAPTSKPVGLSGENYRRTRAQAAWALESINKIIPAEIIDGLDWRWLSEQVERSPGIFLAACGEFAARAAKTPLADLLVEAEAGRVFPRVIVWTLLDTRRVTLVPPGHWLLLEDSTPFRATLRNQDENAATIHVRSIAAGTGYIACFPPRASAAEAEYFWSVTPQLLKMFWRPFVFCRPNRHNLQPSTFNLQPWSY